MSISVCNKGGWELVGGADSFTEIATISSISGIPHLTIKPNAFESLLAYAESISRLPVSVNVVLGMNPAASLKLLGDIADRLLRECVTPDPRFKEMGRLYSLFQDEMKDLQKKRLLVFAHPIVTNLGCGESVQLFLLPICDHADPDYFVLCGVAATLASTVVFQTDHHFETSMLWLKNVASVVGKFVKNVSFTNLHILSKSWTPGCAYKLGMQTNEEYVTKSLVNMIENDRIICTQLVAGAKCFMYQTDANDEAEPTKRLIAPYIAYVLDSGKPKEYKGRCLSAVELIDVLEVVPSLTDLRNLCDEEDFGAILEDSRKRIAEDLGVQEEPEINLRIDPCEDPEEEEESVGQLPWEVTTNAPDDDGQGLCCPPEQRWHPSKSTCDESSILPSFQQQTSYLAPNICYTREAAPPQSGPSSTTSSVVGRPPWEISTETPFDQSFPSSSVLKQQDGNQTSTFTLDDYVDPKNTNYRIPSFRNLLSGTTQLSLDDNVASTLIDPSLQQKNEMANIEQSNAETMSANISSAGHIPALSASEISLDSKAENTIPDTINFEILRRVFLNCEVSKRMSPNDLLAQYIRDTSNGVSVTQQQNVLNKFEALVNQMSEIQDCVENSFKNILFFENEQTLDTIIGQHFVSVTKGNTDDVLSEILKEKIIKVSKAYQDYNRSVRDTEERYIDSAKRQIVQHLQLYMQNGKPEKQIGECMNMIEDLLRDCFPGSETNHAYLDDKIASAKKEIRVLWTTFVDKKVGTAGEGEQRQEEPMEVDEYCETGQNQPDQGFKPVGQGQFSSSGLGSSLRVQLRGMEGNFPNQKPTPEFELGGKKLQLAPSVFSHRSHDPTPHPDPRLSQPFLQHRPARPISDRGMSGASQSQIPICIYYSWERIVVQGHNGHLIAPVPNTLAITSNGVILGASTNPLYKRFSFSEFGAKISSDMLKTADLNEGGLMIGISLAKVFATIEGQVGNDLSVCLVIPSILCSHFTAIFENARKYFVGNVIVVEEATAAFACFQQDLKHGAGGTVFVLNNENPPFTSAVTYELNHESCKVIDWAHGIRIPSRFLKGLDDESYHSAIKSITRRKPYPTAAYVFSKTSMDHIKTYVKKFVDKRFVRSLTEDDIIHGGMTIAKSNSQPPHSRNPTMNSLLVVCSLQKTISGVPEGCSHKHMSTIYRVHSEYDRDLQRIIQKDKSDTEAYRERVKEVLMPKFLSARPGKKKDKINSDMQMLDKMASWKEMEEILDRHTQQ